MGAVGFLSVLRLRRRWRSSLGVGLLIGILGGVALFSIAGGRSTQRSFDDYLRVVHSSTMSVTTNGAFDVATNATIAALPGVEQSRTYVGFNLAVLVDGRPDFAQNFEGVGTFDGRYFDQDRFTATSGRLADPTRIDEVVVNEHAAQRYGYRLGQYLDLGVYSLEQRLAPTFFAAPPPPAHMQGVTIVGIGLFPSEVIHDDGDRTERLLVTPAFSVPIADLATYGAQGLVLARGAAGVDAVRAAISATVPPGSIEFQAAGDDALRARQALRPFSITLTLFGGVIGIVGLVLGTQALARLHRVEREEQATLRAFGASTRSMALVSLITLGVVALAGTLLAVILAVVASPLMPIGPVRRLEADHAFHLDVAAVGIGAIALFAGFAAALAFIVWSESAERQARRGPRLVRRSRIAAAAAAAGLSPTAVIGIESAFQQPSSNSAIHSRSVIAGAALGIAAVVGALTFGASLTTLVRTPQSFGWNWDATLLNGLGYDNFDVASATSILSADPHVRAWSGAYFGTVVIDGQDVSALGMAIGSTVVPTIVNGRMIQTSDEIVLGAATSALLHKHIGDEVAVADENGATHRLTVVGTAIFPAIGRVHTEHTSLGNGAIVVPDLIPGHDIDILGNPGANLGPHVIFVRYMPGTNAAIELAHLTETTGPLGGVAGLDVFGSRRPAEIVNSDSVGNAPLLVAGTLAVGATISLALALGASVRRRSRDLAVLFALGFTRRQLAATVAWHATSTTLTGLTIGVPVGIIGGRQLWTEFADRLYVVPAPTVPWTIAVVGIAAICVANVVAALPARSARNVEPSQLSQPS